MGKEVVVEAQIKQWQILPLNFLNIQKEKH